MKQQTIIHRTQNQKNYENRKQKSVVSFLNNSGKKKSNFRKNKLKVQKNIKLYKCPSG
jgi:hypothetical protein